MKGYAEIKKQTILDAISNYETAYNASKTAYDECVARLKNTPVKKWFGLITTNEWDELSRKTFSRLFYIAMFDEPKAYMYVYDEIRGAVNKLKAQAEMAEDFVLCDTEFLAFVHKWSVKND